MGGSRAGPTLADYNAAFRARAAKYRAHARVLREQAETVCIAMLRHELLQMAEDYEDLAESIEGLGFRDD
jgi:hypothetical protein